jgi:hypothetical protein
MHWLGPYVIRFITQAGVVQMEKLDGEFMEGMVNESRLKLYRDKIIPCISPNYAECVL